MSRTKITKLTKEQTDLLAVWRDKWIDIGLRTGPADRKRAERGIRAQYELIGKKCPPIVWVTSPLVGALAAPIAANFIAAIRAVREQMPQLIKGGELKLPASLSAKAEKDAAAVCSAVYSAVDSAVYSAVYSAVGSALDSAVAVGSAVDSAVHSAVAVGSAVDSAVDSAVGSAVGSAAKSKIWWHSWCGGHLWCSYVAWATYHRDVLGVEMPKALESMEDDRSESGCWWPNKDFVMVCERPTKLERDGQGRLHSTNGQAIEYGDGWGLYMVHGVRVPAKVVEAPQTLTIKEMETERNAEIRRVMLERYGTGRFLIDSGAKEIHRDECGVLYRKDLAGDEPLVMVRVLNSTPEPDGSLTSEEAVRVFGKAAHKVVPGKMWKEYQLRVPPNVRTAREAVAWTCDVSPEDYAPQVET